MTINVPFAGTELDISTDEEGNPVNQEDWIRYKWCQRHPRSELEAQMNREFGKRFYILDPQKKLGLRITRFKFLKMLIKFIKASRSSDKMKHVVRLMSNTTNPDTLTKELENLLYELKTLNLLSF